MTDKVIKKLDNIDRKLGHLSTIEDKLESVVEKEDKEIVEIENEEDQIEKALVKLGAFTIKRSHLLELARGTAGAFLGVGLGQVLINSVNLAKKLHWLNIAGILVFVFLLVGVLVYKNDKTIMSGSKKHPLRYIGEKIIFLYAISLAVELVGLFLFNNFPGWNSLLVKSLLAGSFAAMSSAAAFSII